MSTQIHSSNLLNTREAARWLGLAAGTLQNWRFRGQGPAFIRLGKAIRYEPESLARFVEQGRTAKSTRQQTREEGEA